jgi:hypothetical protein
MLSPVEFETGTLRKPGAGLAASRLAYITRKIITTTSEAQPA